MAPFTVIGAESRFWLVIDVVFGFIGLVTVALAAATIARQVWRAWRAPIITGADGLTGRVLLDGALWAVRSASAPLAVGQLVRVRALQGLELVVEPVGWNGSASDMVTMLLPSPTWRGTTRRRRWPPRPPGRSARPSRRAGRRW